MTTLVFVQNSNVTINIKCKNSNVTINMKCNEYQCWIDLMIKFLYRGIGVCELNFHSTHTKLGLCTNDLKSFAHRVGTRGRFKTLVLF